MKRTLIFVIALLLVPLTGAHAEDAAKPSTLPNIVFILADDLIPVLTEKMPVRQRTLFWRRKTGPRRKVREEGLAVRQAQWKLVKQATGERYLFDLQSDIGEARNLVDENPELTARLDAELVAWENQMDYD